MAKNYFNKISEANNVNKAIESTKFSKKTKRSAQS